MSYSFFILGGDMRMYYLAKKIANDGFDIKMLGFEKIDYRRMLNNNIKMAQSISEIKNEDIVIGSIPITMDNKYIYTPFGNEKIELDEIKDIKIIAGKLPMGFKGIDILKDESFAILNGIPTAEGSIAKAIQETKKTIDKSNVLVLGYGRIGKILCDRLKGVGANVYCCARRKTDLTWMKAYGYNPIKFNELDKEICKMNVIFNTIPYTVLDKKRLILMKKDTIIIDLASKPGGVEWDSAEKMNIKTFQYLGIPGKVAPETVAEYIKEYIYEEEDVKFMN